MAYSVVFTGIEGDVTGNMNLEIFQCSEKHLEIIITKGISESLNFVFDRATAIKFVKEMKKSIANLEIE